jgi:hypothetical protein
VPVHYAVMESEALITSHCGALYERDPRYPAAAQPRDYKAERVLQFAVQARAQRLDPWQVLTDSVLPVDGPPVVRRDGVILSGNGRTQSMRLAMEQGLYEQVRAGIFERAAWFGFDAAAARIFREPILVRVMDDDVVNLVELARYGVEMNRDPAHGMSAVEQSIGLARLMDESTVEQLAAIAAATPDGFTTREFMRRRAREIAMTLSASGLVDPCKRSECFTDGGDLTEVAKDLVENLLAGVALSDIAVLRSASLSTRDRLSRAGIEFLRMRRAGPSWDLARFNDEAVRLRTEAENAANYLRTLRPRIGGSTSLVERLLHPERFRFANVKLLGGQASTTHPAVEALALALELKPREYVALLARYASRCDDQASLLRNVHPAEVFNATIGRHRNSSGHLDWYCPVEFDDWELALAA